MKESIAFYESLLNMRADFRNPDRWVEFHCGNTLALWNPEFDKELIRKKLDVSDHFNEAYLKYKQEGELRYGNNVILNFNVIDLNAEYKRVKSLGIGVVSEIFYINVVRPYYCFMLEDPDGNLIEITGDYKAN